MEEFMRTKLRQHPEVSPHINLCLFEHRAPRAEVIAARQKMKAQSNLLAQLEKTANELRSRVDSLRDKKCHRGRNRMSRKGEGI